MVAERKIDRWQHRTVGLETERGEFEGSGEIRKVGKGAGDRE